MPEKREQPEQPQQPNRGEASGEAEWQRRRRLAAVFGDVLPETTSDERDPEQTDGDDPGDRWLRSQVPPHHG